MIRWWRSPEQSLPKCGRITHWRQSFMCTEAQIRGHNLSLVGPKSGIKALDWSTQLTMLGMSRICETEIVPVLVKL
jgi:hypothetical protein